MTVTTFYRLFAVLLISLPATNVVAAFPYAPVPVIGPPVVGPGVMPPDLVYGKEFSHDVDYSSVTGAADPQQVVLWDGGGGTLDGVDFSGTRPFWEEDQQIDAIANTRDSLYSELRRDEAHLIFTHDDVVATVSPGISLMPVPSSGPVFLSNGFAIGGAGEVSFEEAGAFSGFPTQATWAPAPAVSGMPLPVDVDGLEVWGPEPVTEQNPDLPAVSDTDKYSLDVDFPSGTSVWNASGTEYLSWTTVVSAVESLLGPIPGSAFSPRDGHQGFQAINLDALMVQDVLTDPDIFGDNEPLEPSREPVIDQNGEPIFPHDEQGEVFGDQVIFSIRQIVDPEDTDGYYATGSELFVLDSLKGASFLKHGGHDWDHAYALSELVFVGTEQGEPEGLAVIDINGIEAIGEDQFDPCLPGDYNCDGSVDAADYTIWRDSKGTSGMGLDADGNKDGMVDGLDYDIWVANYGASVMPATATSVPEPTSAVLLLLSLLGLGRSRRS